MMQKITVRRKWVITGAVILLLCFVIAAVPAARWALQSHRHFSQSSFEFYLLFDREIADLSLVKADRNGQFTTAAQDGNSPAFNSANIAISEPDTAMQQAKSHFLSLGYVSDGACVKQCQLNRGTAQVELSVQKDRLLIQKTEM